MRGKYIPPTLRITKNTGKFVFNSESCRCIDLFDGCHVNIYYCEKRDIWLIGKADETGFKLRNDNADYSLVFYSKYLIHKIFESIAFDGNSGLAMIVGSILIEDKNLWHIKLDSFRN